MLLVIEQAFLTNQYEMNQTTCKRMHRLPRLASGSSERRFSTYLKCSCEEGTSVPTCMYVQNNTLKIRRDGNGKLKA